LSGERTIEATIASTSQMFDCHTGDWAEGILSELGLPIPQLRPTTNPGDEIGSLRKKLAEDTGLPIGMRVVAPATHDTASAVAAVPGEPASAGGTSWCYLSSGTWSLLGAEIAKPCVTSAAQAVSFTNERGVANKIRFLKNIPGLWLVQECRREFARQGQEFDYATLTRLANDADAFGTLVDSSHEAFQSPGDMPRKIAEFARATGQPAPQSPGQFVRACLESLALAYREKLETLEAILGRRFEVIHVVGGGGKNALLSQMTAGATGRRVVVGPYEATASGNALVQAMAAHEIGNLDELRRIVAQSFELVEHHPAHGDRWHKAYESYKAICHYRTGT
jgi:rhamnulokinase